MTDEHKNSTDVTRVDAPRTISPESTMSYTAVTSHPDMATAFSNRLLELATRIIPDRRLKIEDIISICRLSLSQVGGNMVVLEGRQLRGRISEQLSRARRYNEPFSLLVLKLNDDVSKAVYESAVDILCERMRQTDLLFTFKKRIVLLLPHTEEPASIMLVKRIDSLIVATLENSPVEAIEHLAFPCPTITKASQVLDWAEDQIR